MMSVIGTDSIAGRSSSMDEVKDTLSNSRSVAAANFAAAMFLAHKEHRPIAEVFLERHPRSAHRDVVQKTAVGAGGTSAWGSTLVTPAELGRGMLDVSRPLVLLFRLLLLGARAVPFNIRIPRVTSEAEGFTYITGGQAIPCLRASLDSSTLRLATAGGIWIVTEELARFGGAPLRDHFRGGISKALNRLFVDPANAGAADPVEPASITYNVTPVAASSGDPVEDLRTALRAYVADGGNISTAVILISSANASALALRSNANDGPDFSGLTVGGGTLAGLPCLASDALQDQIVVLDSTQLLVADSGELDVDLATSASIEMSDSPTQNTANGTGASVVSLWQANAVAYRIIAGLNWSYEGPIAVVNGAAYLSEGGSPA